MFHKLHLSSGSCQVMRSRIRCPCFSIHCSAIQPAGTSINSRRLPQTVARIISRSDSRDEVNCAPQCGHTSFIPAPCFTCGGTRFRCRDAIALIIVLIVFLLLFIAVRPCPPLQPRRSRMHSLGQRVGKARSGNEFRARSESLDRFGELISRLAPNCPAALYSCPVSIGLSRAHRVVAFAEFSARLPAKDKVNRALSILWAPRIAKLKFDVHKFLNFFFVHLFPSYLTGLGV